MQGWRSLGKQFEGPAVWLSRRNCSSWIPTWCAYTSSVAVAQPNDRVGICLVLSFMNIYGLFCIASVWGVLNRNNISILSLCKLILLFVFFVLASYLPMANNIFFLLILSTQS